MAKCYACEGRKKVRGIGMMMEKCKPCKGSGIITALDVLEKVKDDTVKLKPEVISEKKSKGGANAKRET